MSSRSLKEIRRQVYKGLQASVDRIADSKADICGSASVLANNVIRNTVDEIRNVLPVEMLQYEFVAALHRKWHSKAKVTFDPKQPNMFAANMHLTLGASEYVEWGKATVPQVRLGRTLVAEARERMSRRVDQKLAIFDDVIREAEELHLTGATVAEIVKAARGYELVIVEVDPEPEPGDGEGEGEDA